MISQLYQPRSLRTHEWIISHQSQITQLAQILHQYYQNFTQLQKLQISYQNDMAQAMERLSETKTLTLSPAHIRTLLGPPGPPSSVDSVGLPLTPTPTPNYEPKVGTSSFPNSSFSSWSAALPKSSHEKMPKSNHEKTDIFLEIPDMEYERDLVLYEKENAKKN